MWAAGMVPNDLHPSKRRSDDSDIPRAIADERSAEEEERRERSREYRRRYKERQKEKDIGMQQLVENTELEVERLRLEQANLIAQSNALASLTFYSNSMIEALSAATSSSAAKARSLGEKAKEGFSSIQNWAKHRWNTTPTAAEVIAGTAWTPTDDQFRWVLRVLNPENILANNATFLDRIARILEEGKASPEAQKKSELKVAFAIQNWRRFNVVLYQERPELLEDVVCVHHLKALREQAAAGKYVRPLLLQNVPGQLSERVELNSEQIEQLEEPWQQFVRDIKAARSFLGKYTSKVADDLEAVMDTGVYTPASSAQAAQSFLFTFDAANASDEFLRREGQAFIKLYIGTVQVLSPMQTAIVLTQIRPLVPHLPEVCEILLNSNNNNNNNNNDQPAIKSGNSLNLDEINTQ